MEDTNNTYKEAIVEDKSSNISCLQEHTSFLEELSDQHLANWELYYKKMLCEVFNIKAKRIADLGEVFQNDFDNEE
ncbi:hypothetical protein AGMMS50249_4890 [candidate division SR1 bacterium]|nr:hypothetical protein AGMMS50249_4890 [candidate division SR1 bacterium]